MSESLDYKQAYVAMYLFIKDFYHRIGEPYELRLLLSGMMLHGETYTSDPAFWDDWINAIKKSLEDPDSANYRALDQ